MFRRFLNSVTKIFDLPAWFQQIPSTGIEAIHTPRTVAAFVLVGSLLRMRSFEQLEGWIRRGRFRRFCAGFVSADTIRRQLVQVSPAIWHDLLHQIARKLGRNRAWPVLGGLHVVAIDGVELFVQHSVTCADCLQRTVNKTLEWFHRIVVASTVGPTHRFVLDWETVHPRDGDAKQEGEQTAAYRLLDTLFRQYHHQIDVIVADALYASRVFVEAVRKHGWDVVIRLKDSQRLTILSDAQGLKKITDPVNVWGSACEQVKLWDFVDLGWDRVEHLRVIAWERTAKRRRRGRRHRNVWIITTQKGWILTTLGDSVSALTIYDMMHHRWDLEECIFRQGKTTWQLQHCFGHDPAIIEALVGAQLAAVTLWNWWTDRRTVSPQYRRMSRRTWMEIAREELGLMRTTWTARWRLPPT